ncbi:zinc ribbon domain-containing protein [bacterium]|nr:zinc ribbon domain-containing protein [bacterium]MCB2179205.1 zinc ribbon domain-containing protein [bacterium]
MAKKNIGYVELQWECPNCGTINPGPVKVCQGCGAPQPENVEFQQASSQQLITDEKKLTQAKAGADIHCPYCGTRNPAGATTCSQCRAELSQGQKRDAGRVVGAFSEGEVATIQCPHCGAENPETASRCAQCGGSLKQAAPQKAMPDTASPQAAKPGSGRNVLIVLGVIAILACAAIYFIFLRTTATTGTVTGLDWERSYVLEQIVPVEYEAWYADIPADGEVVSCEQEEYERVNEPVDGSQEICGTPYSVDTGSGFAEVVQDCEYIVYEDYCTYTLMEWGAVDTVSVTGSGLNAAWPNPSLAADQRLGEGAETYLITFESDGDEYTYTTNDYSLFQQAEIGTKWELEINAIGGVQSIGQ